MAELQPTEALGSRSNLGSIETQLSIPLTDKTWPELNQSLIELTDLCKNKTIDQLTLLKLLENHGEAISNAMMCDRTKLSGTAINLVQEIGRYLGPEFQTLIDLFVPSLMKLLAKTSKIFISRATTALTQLSMDTLLPSFLPYYFLGLEAPSKNVRLASTQLLDLAVTNFRAEDLILSLDDIERCIDLSVVDKAPEVRTVGQALYKKYIQEKPDRVDNLSGKLSDVAKKHLKIHQPPSQTEQKPLRKKIHLSAFTLAKKTNPETNLETSIDSEPSLQN